MTRINLLPAEVLAARRSAFIVRRATVVGLALLGLLIGLYAIQSWQVVSVRGELANVRSQRMEVERQIDGYADLVAQRAMIGSAKAVVAGLYRGEVSWSQQMLTFATTVPQGFVVTSLTGSTASGEGQVIGSITWSGSASSYLVAGAWLTELDARDGWANAWAATVQGAEGAVSLSGSVDLTPEAITARGGGPA